MLVIEYTPTRTSSLDDTPSLDIAEALVVTAIDKHIHLDRVYFLLWRARTRYF